MDFQEEESLHMIFGQIMRLHFQRWHFLLDELGVYPGQPPLLFALYHQDGINQKELSQKLLVKPATVAVMIQRMEKAQLVERRADENDRRVSLVFIQPKGVEIVQKLDGRIKEIEAECFQNFTEEEKILIRRFFLQMKDNLMTYNNGKSKEDQTKTKR